MGHMLVGISNARSESECVTTFEEVNNQVIQTFSSATSNVNTNPGNQSKTFSLTVHSGGNVSTY